MSAEDCIFCRIVAGEIPSHTIYEDEAVMAFLDANPLTEGHTLIIPKDHYETTAEMPDAVGAGIGRTVTQLAPIIEDTVGADASTIGMNNGSAAGQEIPHAHVHIIPRTEGDSVGPLHALFDGQTEVPDEQLAATADEIADAFQS